MGFATHIRRYCPRTWFAGKFLKYKYVNGEPELRLLRRIVPPGKTAIDVGSSIGLYARELARHVPKVLAFEANPVVAAFARTVAASNVEVINVALSAHVGRTMLRIPINRRDNPVFDLATIEARNELPFEQVVTAEVVTARLDDYELPECGFIKIDVEGHEEAVLDGARRLIETHRPVLMIELAERHNPGSIRRVHDRLSGLGYDASFLSDGRLRPISEFDQELHQGSSAADKYIDNFFFLPVRTR